MPPPSPDLSVPCERGMRCSARSGEGEDSSALSDKLVVKAHRAIDVPLTSGARQRA